MNTFFITYTPSTVSGRFVMPRVVTIRAEDDSTGTVKQLSWNTNAPKVVADALSAVGKLFHNQGFLDASDLVSLTKKGLNCERPFTLCLQRSGQELSLACAPVALRVNHRSMFSRMDDEADTIPEKERLYVSFKSKKGTPDQVDTLIKRFMADSIAVGSAQKAEA
jgi:hypothetical protein